MKSYYVLHLSVLIFSYFILANPGEGDDIQNMSQQELIDIAKKAGAQAAEKVFKKRDVGENLSPGTARQGSWAWKKIVLGSSILGSSLVSGLWWGCRKLNTDLWGLSNFSINALNGWFNKRILGKVETIESEITQLKEQNKKEHTFMSSHLDRLECMLVDIDNGQTEYCNAFNDLYRKMSRDHDGLAEQYTRMHEDVADIADRMATAEGLETGLFGVQSTMDEAMEGLNLRFDGLTNEMRELRFAAEKIIKDRSSSKAQGVFYVNIAGLGSQPVPFY